VTTEHGVFACSECGLTTEHDLRYAGRLLESTRCSHCGHVVELQQRVLLPAYLHDLEQRLVSKPGRLLRRAARDGLPFLRELPAAIVRQPFKIAREIWTVVKRS